jgi:hypothetical protein
MAGFEGTASFLPEVIWLLEKALQLQTIASGELEPYKSICA